MAAFFTVHDGLPREGPGGPDDVRRAANAAGLAPGARIADMGSGPGGDVAALLDAFPGSHVTAVDSHKPFVEAAQRRFGGSDRVEVIRGDMAAIDGPFDLIWSAGALYFLGLEDGLATMSRKLAPGGVLAFSHPCHFTDMPSAAARALWQGEDAEVGSREELLFAVSTAGFSLLDDWKVGDVGWEAYYLPLVARAATLRSGADEALLDAIAASEAEYAAWQRAKEETGYLMVVARET